MPTKPSENAVARLKRRITDRLDADRGRPRPFRRTQQGLAERIGITKATLNELLNGPASNRGLLAHLDKIADYFGVPPSLLIHRNDTSLLEITSDEYRLLRHWRSFPADVQLQVLALFDFFAGLLPEEKEDRRLFQKWRRLGLQDRAYAERTIDDLLRAAARDRSAARELKASPAHEVRRVESTRPTRGRVTR